MPEKSERVTYRTLSKAIEAMRKEIKGDISDVQKQISALSARIENNYVTQKEFVPLKQDVNDLQGSIRWVVITVLGVVIIAILKLVIVG
ncbi:MAG: hypothetical protein PHQ61_08620 [Candidatus Omnitrophica bacterium]|nr:hypothetical protein [Candidatus Omnitrophota bacterium]